MKYPSIVAAAALLCAPLALAHVHLVASTPAGGSVLVSAPTTIMLKFPEAARLTALGIRKAGSTSLQKLGPLPVKPALQFTIAAPALTPGVYTVQFRALDPEDGHVSSGKFTFTLAPAARESPLRKDAMRDIGKPPAPDTIK
jgi:methionine-rich copper-binding protein CopC